MKSLVCPKCKQEKLITDFYQNCKKCDKCKSCYKKLYESKKEQYAEYREKNREIIREKNREIYKKNKEIYRKTSNKKYHSQSPEKKLENNRKMWERRKQDPIKKEKHYENVRKSFNKHREERNKRRAERHKERYKEDISYRLEVLLRTRLYKAVKRYKMKSALNLVGCSSEELKGFLESKFKPEMTWENFGKIWEIDHIVPVNSFNMSIEEEQRKCFHFTNLQPLFKTTKIALSFGYKDEIGNMNKRNKIIN